MAADQAIIDAINKRRRNDTPGPFDQAWDFAKSLPGKFSNFGKPEAIPMSSDFASTDERDAYAKAMNAPKPPQLGMGDLTREDRGEDLDVDARNPASAKPENMLAGFKAKPQNMMATQMMSMPDPAVKAAVAARSTARDDMQRAQMASNDNSMYANIGDAGGDLGAAIAGVKRAAPAGYDNLKKTANAPVEQLEERTKFGRASDLTDPNSVQSNVARNLAKAQLKSAGQDPNQVDGMSAQDLSDFMQKGLSSLESAETRKASMKMHNDLVGLKQRELNDDKFNKRITLFGDSLDENKGRTGEFGRQQQLVNSSDRALVLGKQFADGNLPPAQVAELATSVAGLVSGGSHAAEATVHRFVPSTYSGSEAGISQWLTSEPKGAGQQAFVKQLLETAQRERQQAVGKIHGIKMSRVAQFEDLQRQNPTAFNAVLQSKGVDPEEYAKFKAGGYKVQAAAPASLNMGGVLSYDDPDKEKRYQAFKASQGIN